MRARAEKKARLSQRHDSVLRRKSAYLICPSFFSPASSKDLFDLRDSVVAYSLRVDVVAGAAGPADDRHIMGGPQESRWAQCCILLDWEGVPRCGHTHEHGRRQRLRTRHLSVSLAFQAGDLRCCSTCPAQTGRHEHNTFCRCVRPCRRRSP